MGGSIYMRPVERKTGLREWIFMGGVLFVLTVLLGTIFIKQREDALRVAGTRNLQQWGIALSLYLTDHDNQLPDVGEAPITSAQTNAWYNALPPYISRPALAELPPDEIPRPGVPSMWIDPASSPVRVWDSSQFYFEYGMNRALQPSPQTRSFRIYEIENAANVVMLAPTSGYTPEATPENAVFRYGAKDSSSKASTFVLFCDGHVESVTRARLVDDPATREASSAAQGRLSWYEK